MLHRLTVQNYALIDQAEVLFRPGLNLLTGETGAGKSLLVGAIGLILGERADLSVLLDGEEKCIVEAEFRLADAQRVAVLLAPHELEPEDEVLVVRRMLLPSGRSRAFINDQPVTLPVLRAICSQLVELHGQHDGLRLLSATEQLQMLDRYADTGEQVLTFGRQWREWQATQRELARLLQAAAERIQRQDFLQFQVAELSEAALQAGEDDELEAELKRLEHAEQLKASLFEIAQSLCGEELAADERLAAALQRAETVARLLPEAAALAALLRDAQALVQDANQQAEKLAHDLELSPERLQEVHQRLDVINRLKLKYQKTSVAALLEAHEAFSQELATLSGADARIQGLQQQVSEQEAALIQTGLTLEAAREKAAQALSAAVTATLQEVGLKGASFRADVTRTTAESGALAVEGQLVQPQVHGFNACTFFIQTNPGLPEGPLAKVASGGEISRVMLALKTALAERVALSVLIFDEIDTGISGEVALRVGRVLERLAVRHQVLSITHLPQIASRSGAHYHIRKEQANDRTRTRIDALSQEQRVEAVAALLSGHNPSASARQSARELMGHPSD